MNRNALTISFLVVIFSITGYSTEITWAQPKKSLTLAELGTYTGADREQRRVVTDRAGHTPPVERGRVEAARRAGALQHPRPVLDVGLDRQVRDRAAEIDLIARRRRASAQRVQR